MKHSPLKLLFFHALFFSSAAYAIEDIGLPNLGLEPQIASSLSEAQSNAIDPIAEEPQQAEINLKNNPDQHVPLTADCIKRVSSGYGIHPDVLFAILLAEGGTIGKTNTGNSDGTKDLSLFQINEVNLPELKSSFEITREDVLNNGCLGAAIAARHLLRSIKDAKPPTNRIEYLSMIARYHSKTPEYNAAYALRLEEKFEYLYKLDQENSTSNPQSMNN